MKDMKDNFYVVLFSCNGKYTSTLEPMKSRKDAQKIVDNLQPTNGKLTYFVGELSVLPPIDMVKFNRSEGDHIPLKDFRAHARSGSILPYDGHGVYATDSQKSNVLVDFNDITPPRKEFTHVLWYNK